MPMARCNDCGRVLNQDNSCSSALECKNVENHSSILATNLDTMCVVCGHSFFKGEK